MVGRQPRIPSGRHEPARGDRPDGGGHPVARGDRHRPRRPASRGPGGRPRRHRQPRRPGRFGPLRGRTEAARPPRARLPPAHPGRKALAMRELPGLARDRDLPVRGLRGDLPAAGPADQGRARRARRGRARRGGLGGSGARHPRGRSALPGRAGDGRRMEWALGSEAQLRPVWEGLRHPAAAPRRRAPGRIALVDARGVQRIGFPLGQATPERIAHDVRLLAAEAG